MVSNSKESHTLSAISTGGGIIEIIDIDGVKVSLAGDYFETLIYVGSDGDQLLAHLKENIQFDEIIALRSGEIQFLEIKSQRFLPIGIIAAFAR